jgi:RNA polymerase sigma factor (sigma-70 family)
MEAGTVPRLAAPRISVSGPRLIRLASDARLVTLVREGRTGAFEAVYDRHHRGILSFCRHMLGDQHEAEDALQHTFMAAYSSLLASRQPIQLRPWLFAIARNRCYSVLRAQRERPTAELDQPVTDGLAAEVQRRQDLRDLVSDLNRLPDEQRAAIVLAELESLTHAEIADVLGVPRDKVKALVFQARESLLASRTARDTSCHEIRQELAIGRGAALRRGNLRRHLRDCEGCRAYRAQVQRQRRQFGLLLPIPTILVKEGLLAAALGAGGAAAVGGSGLIASSALKTGMLKGIAAVVIAGVGTLGTVVVSASDLPVRALDAGISGHPGHARAARAPGRAAAGSRHSSDTGATVAAGASLGGTSLGGASLGGASLGGASLGGASLAGPAHASLRGVRHQLWDVIGSRTGRAARRHLQAAAREPSPSAPRQAGAVLLGHHHPTLAPPGRSPARVAPGPPGFARRSVAELPPGRAKHLARAMSSRATRTAITPRIRAQISRSQLTPPGHAADGPRHARAGWTWAPGHARKHAAGFRLRRGPGHSHR